MKGIVKVLLQEGIDEETIHEVLAVIEENIKDVEYQMSSPKGYKLFTHNGQHYSYDPERKEQTGKGLKVEGKVKDDRPKIAKQIERLNKNFDSSRKEKYDSQRQLRTVNKKVKSGAIQGDSVAKTFNKVQANGAKARDKFDKVQKEIAEIKPYVKGTKEEVFDTYPPKKGDTLGFKPGVRVNK